MISLDSKTILVSKRKLDNDGHETFDTYFGKVKCFNENTVIVTSPSGEDESLPYGEQLYEADLHL